MSDAMAPLKIRHFRTLWLAAMFSNLGSFLQAVAGSWLMLELTGSATWVGLMVASTTLPLFFLALPAGALADLFDRGTILLVSQGMMGGAAAAMAIVTYSGDISPGLLLTLGLLLGVGVAFNLPAWQAMVPDLVPRGLVASAVALNSVAFNVARAVGPAIGGLILATSGPELAFGLNAASYAIVIAVIFSIRGQLSVADHDASSIPNAIALGIRFARYTKPFRRLLLLASLFAITSAVIQSVLPTRTEELGGGEFAYGLLLGAMGLGALIGAFTRKAVVERLGDRSIPTTITAFGVFGILQGLAGSLALATAALVAIGACWVWTLTTTNATAQLMSPEWVRGRTMSLYTLSFVGIIPFGSIIAGALADAIGAGAATVTLSVGTVVLGTTARRFAVPALAEIDSPEFSLERTGPDHISTQGGPVMVVNTWVIDHDRFDEFIAVMNEVKAIRMRTGAYRWRLYRNAVNPHRLSEVFHLVSWDEHLAQHRRIDDSSRILLRSARDFDVEQSPTTYHLIAVDTEAPDDWDVLVAAHEDYHASDGSIPLSPEPRPATDR
ncbi:MAG: MFS transporter [Acidimicrobiia bacterium]|nr:MFS transporter [Acidimicrobiia bacterium]